MDPQLANLLSAIIGALDRLANHPAITADIGLHEQMDTIREHAGYLTPWLTSEPDKPHPAPETALPMVGPGHAADF